MSQIPPTPSSTPSPAPSPSRPTTAPSPYRRNRLAAGAAFFVQGLLFISLTTRLPQIQRRWDLDELAVSGLLFMVVLLAGLGSVAVGAENLRIGFAVPMVLILGIIPLAAQFSVVGRRVGR